MIGILGGGLTGFILADHIKDDVIIIEKNSYTGGLCSTTRIDGYTFDIGGSHILFSKNKKALNYYLNKLKGNAIKKKRNSKIYYHGKLIKYPFENGLNELDKYEAYECVRDFINKPNALPQNFGQLLHNYYGKAMADKYLIPYNKKIWKRCLKNMDFKWASRMPMPSTDDVLKSALGIETEGYTHQLYYYYPATGGIHAIIDSIMKQKDITVITNHAVKKIEKGAGDTWLVDGYKFNKLYSTIPLPALANALGVPEGIRKAINSLEHLSLITVNIGVRNYHNDDELSWVYFPDPQTIFHRISFSHSPYNSPKGCGTICAEISTNPRQLKLPDTSLLDIVARQLEGLGFLERACMDCAVVSRFEYAYPVEDLKYYQKMKYIKKYFDDIGIKLVGRFAEWDYRNMDRCYEVAVESI